ncbi:hypothetical protein BDV12DRAFT_198966 [Aspergillus spectabilis]
MERLQNKTNVCLSGAADGADIEWGKYATSIGHDVIHWSFPGHHSQAPENQVIWLTDEQLMLGIEALNNAAKAIGKNPPTRPTVTRLLRRNYYQVVWSQSCYVVTVIRDNPGGTVWATTMFAQLHPGNENLFLFDQDKDGWLQFRDGTWVRIDAPPMPSSIWAGIGSRGLKPNGRDAIRRLMGGLGSES